MKIHLIPLAIEDRHHVVSAALHAGARLGFVTSIDGKQVITAVFWPLSGVIECFASPVEGTEYPSLTLKVPQAHWFERTMWDMFGLKPTGHPRLKHTHLHEPFQGMSPPLVSNGIVPQNRAYKFLRVEGKGLYEIPVGPIHAGIIEPAHFRFSCYGELITNLEIRLGYVHRGVEKRLTEVPWNNTRFIAEAAASDMAIANALANSTAIESFFDIEIPRSSLLLRTIASEIERTAMHLSDLAGIAGDIAFLGIASSFSRMRGIALGMGEQLSGNRFMRNFVCPGGIRRTVTREETDELRTMVMKLQRELKPIVKTFLQNQVAMDRLENIGRITTTLAHEFGFVGITARASGIDYDCRKVWTYATYPETKFTPSVGSTGDALERTKLRIAEIEASSALVLECLERLADVPLERLEVSLPNNLPKNQSTISIVESHRGELIHFITTDDTGRICRYYIKDSSVNNWTALAIAVRNHIVADFPLCNKSFSLSYSGHDM